MFHFCIIYLVIQIRRKVQWGEGFSGTTIKDTWTKPRGKVEAGEGCGFGWGGEKMQTAIIE